MKELIMKHAQPQERKEVAILFSYSVILLFLCLFNVGVCGSYKEPEKALKKAESVVNKEQIKSKFHEAADSINREKVHESIDKVADYLDPESLKKEVDQIADYFDRDRVKEFVDYAADHLDRDTIKRMIDVLAESLDRDKFKGAVDRVADSLDVERIKESFDASVDEVAASLRDATHSLEHEIRRLGNNNPAIREVIHKYNWNKLVPDQASYGPATLSSLKLGGLKKAAVVRPGQLVEGEVVCSLNGKQCSPLSLYRVVLGIKNQGGQTTVFNHFGLRAGKETDRFSLVAPKEKGVYEVGFLVVEAAREGTALHAWDELEKTDSRAAVPIGVLIVM
jgi:hypothetical protein